VVLDPLMAFLPPSVAANLDQCVRLALNPLSVLAGRTGCAVKVVRHLGKGRRERAILRGQGSIGIVAAARTALFVAPHPDDPDGRVLAVSKTNVGRRPPALAYRVVGSASGPPVVDWAGPVEVTADGLTLRKREVALKAADRAVDWLRRELAAGPRKAADLYAAAAAALIPERTLDRAKEGLRARSHKEYDFKGRRAEWWWYDPAAPWPKKAPFERPEDEWDDLPRFRD
jgi:hypothetical protein